MLLDFGDDGLQSMRPIASGCIFFVINQFAPDDSGLFCALNCSLSFSSKVAQLCRDHFPIMNSRLVIIRSGVRDRFKFLVRENRILGQEALAIVRVVGMDTHCPILVLSRVLIAVVARTVESPEVIMASGVLVTVMFTGDAFINFFCTDVSLPRISSIAFAHAIVA